MPDQDISSAKIGFLTVVEHADHGFFGGYLVLNAAGRPLEFHCTAPVRPNRAQEILFGPTLAEYLEGDLIAATLLGRAKTPPLSVCTDRLAVLSIRPTVNYPVLLCLADGAETPADLVMLSLGANRAAANLEDRRIVAAKYAAILTGLDLLEPFSRIREALEEARNSATNKARIAAA
jgi:hypothetical protein